MGSMISEQEREVERITERERILREQEERIKEREHTLVIDEEKTRLMKAQNEKIHEDLILERSELEVLLTKKVDKILY